MKIPMQSLIFVDPYLSLSPSNRRPQIATKQKIVRDGRQGVNISKVIGWAVFSLRQSAPP